MPPESLREIPDPKGWTEEEVLMWANHLKVSVEALAIALKEAKLIDEQATAALRKHRVPKDQKTDPELPSTLPRKARLRKETLLSLGLSDFFVNLCFSAYEQHLVSASRLSEMLLMGQHELPEVASLYGRVLNHGD
jgi:hypothetical protein